MDRYRLGKLIGRGGMAEVYEGWRRLGGGREQRVAIKRIRPEHMAEPDFVARFVAEAETGLGLDHPNLVKVLDLDEVRREPWIIMELVDGISLATIMEHFELCHDEMRTILAGVLSALVYTHDRGVLHRDISPGNILISRDGDVKLSDFGLFKRVGAPRSDYNFKGTAAFASPEALACQDVDARTDLYSVGALTYWLVTREFPHGAGHHDQILERMASGSKAAPLPRKTPADLRETITGLLRPVEERIATAAEVLEVLARHRLPRVRPEGLGRVVREIIDYCAKQQEAAPDAPDPEAPSAMASTESLPAPARPAPHAASATAPDAAPSEEPAAASATAPDAAPSEEPAAARATAPDAAPSEEPAAARVRWYTWIIGSGVLLALGAVLAIGVLRLTAAPAPIAPAPLAPAPLAPAPVEPSSPSPVPATGGVRNEPTGGSDEPALPFRMERFRTR